MLGFMFTFYYCAVIIDGLAGADTRTQLKQ